jgi:hypothetical protein
MTPALLFTTLCPTSKIPMTIFHVFVTMRTAQKVLKIHLKNIQVSTSDEYCQGGFSNGTVNTLRTSRICKDFQEKQARNQARKINACRIHEVSAVCAYGLHRSAIRGAVPLVRGFA